MSSQAVLDIQTSLCKSMGNPFRQKILRSLRDRKKEITHVQR